MPKHGPGAFASLYDAFCLSGKNIECKDLIAFAQSTDRRFDVITAFDVLSIYRIPLIFSLSAGTLLKDDGYIFISTPDAGAIAPKIMGKHWHHYNSYHLSYLDRKQYSKACPQIWF